MSRDPIGYEGGWSLYLYVNGNPIHGVDPLGLWSPDWWGYWHWHHRYPQVFRFWFWRVKIDIDHPKLGWMLPGKEHMDLTFDEQYNDLWYEFFETHHWKPTQKQCKAFLNDIESRPDIKRHLVDKKVPRRRFRFKSGTPFLKKPTTVLKVLGTLTVLDQLADPVIGMTRGCAIEEAELRNWTTRLAQNPSGSNCQDAIVALQKWFHCKGVGDYTKHPVYLKFVEICGPLGETNR